MQRLYILVAKLYTCWWKIVHFCFRKICFSSGGKLYVSGMHESIPNVSICLIMFGCVGREGLYLCSSKSLFLKWWRRIHRRLDCLAWNLEAASLLASLEVLAFRKVLLTHHDRKAILALSLSRMDFIPNLQLLPAK